MTTLTVRTFRWKIPRFRFTPLGVLPTPLSKLAESYPEVSLEHEWADEDIGMNCGRKTYEHH